MASFVGSGITRSLMGRVERVRRPETADVMLLVTVVIWSLNFTVTKYVLNHGFKPLAYGGGRFAAAPPLFTGLPGAEGGAVRPRRHGKPLLIRAAVVGSLLGQAPLR